MTTTYTHGVLEVHLPKVAEVFDPQNHAYMAS
jgi:HSP20 family molecular chaperone IbpA